MSKLSEPYVLKQPNNYAKCNCASYNNVIQNAPEQAQAVLLDPRIHFNRTTKTVYVDACIAPIIEKLWVNGIRTLASCCGHNINAKSVTIDDPERIGDAVKVILRMDNNCEWRVNVNKGQKIHLKISECDNETK